MLPRRGAVELRSLGAAVALGAPLLARQHFLRELAGDRGRCEVQARVRLAPLRPVVEACRRRRRTSCRRTSSRSTLEARRLPVATCTAALPTWALCCGVVFSLLRTLQSPCLSPAGILAPTATRRAGSEAAPHPRGGCRSVGENEAVHLRDVEDGAVSRDATLAVIVLVLGIWLDVVFFEVCGARQYVAPRRSEIAVVHDRRFWATDCKSYDPWETMLRGRPMLLA